MVFTLNCVDCVLRSTVGTLRSSTFPVVVVFRASKVAAPSWTVNAEASLVFTLNCVDCVLRSNVLKLMSRVSLAVSTTRRLSAPDFTDSAAAVFCLTSTTAAAPLRSRCPFPTTSDPSSFDVAVFPVTSSA